MNFRELKSIGVAILVIFTIVVGIAACHKEEDSEIIENFSQESKKSHAYIQTILMDIKVPNTVIYVIVSNGVFSICDEPVKQTIPRLKSGNEADDGWVIIGTYNLNNSDYNSAIELLKRTEGEGNFILRYESTSDPGFFKVSYKLI